MNYSDVLPDNWLQIARQSNQAYLNHTIKLGLHPLLARHTRLCLTKGHCPMKRLGGCIMSHCILRYPHDTLLKHFQ